MDFEDIIITVAGILGLAIVGYIAFLILCAGASKAKKEFTENQIRNAWEVVNSKDGGVYRVNKITGESQRIR